jgi:hypothetical protein
MNYERDALVYATVCSLGYYNVNNDDEVICKKSSANCIHTILSSQHYGDVHMKLVPYENPLDDLRIDSVVGKMISIITNAVQELQDFKNNFLQYICSTNMYIKPNDLRIPYKKLFHTQERCSSILYDIITPQFQPLKILPQFKPKEGHFKEYMYTKCIVTRAVNGHTLSYALKNSTDADFIGFLNDNKFYKMCKGMYKLGIDYGFVHNDAHTGNVIIDNTTGDFVLIDYGRSYIDTSQADYIVNQENIKHERNHAEHNDLYYDFWFIKTDKTNRNNKANLAEWLPVMCDIACLSYNIWKRAARIKDDPTSPLFTEITALNKIMKFEGQDIKFDTPLPNIADLRTLSPNMKAIAVGLLWMRCYIITAWKITSNMDKAQVIPSIARSDIEGTSNAPDKILWHFGQIQPSVYNAIKSELNTMLESVKMLDMINAVFAPPRGQAGGEQIVEGKDQIKFTSLGTLTEVNVTTVPAEIIKGPDVVGSDDVKPIIQDLAIDEEAPKVSIFTNEMSPLRYTVHTNIDKSMMLNNYTGYHRYSIAYAQECMNKMASECGNYC